MTVDPGRVPVRKLKGGALMPAIGLGTFGSDRYSAEEVATAVVGALAVGYRHFDRASVFRSKAQGWRAHAGDRVGDVRFGPLLRRGGRDRGSRCPGGGLPALRLRLRLRQRS